MTPAQHTLRLAAIFGDNMRPRAEVLTEVEQYIETIERVAAERARVELQSLHDDSTVTP